MSSGLYANDFAVLLHIFIETRFFALESSREHCQFKMDGMVARIKFTDRGDVGSFVRLISYQSDEIKSRRDEIVAIHDLVDSCGDAWMAVNTFSFIRLRSFCLPLPTEAFAIPDLLPHSASLASQDGEVG